MSIFKNYKKLYEVELNNRKLIEKRYKELKNENIELQKSTGIAELRKEIVRLENKISFLKEDRAKLYIQLEDTRNELNRLKKIKKGRNYGKRKEVLHK